MSRTNGTTRPGFAVNPVLIRFKPDTDVQRLVVGPDVRVCDQCVGLCVEVRGLS